MVDRNPCTLCRVTVELPANMGAGGDKRANQGLHEKELSGSFKPQTASTSLVRNPSTRHCQGLGLYAGRRVLLSVLTWLYYRDRLCFIWAFSGDIDGQYWGYSFGYVAGSKMFFIRRTMRNPDCNRTRTDLIPQCPSPRTLIPT